MILRTSELRLGIVALVAGLLFTLSAYLPGKGGGYIFDDFPNIVDNAGVQPTEVSVGSLVRVALSSPASEFKRPLASLSFAANYLTTGRDPEPMKITNIVIHLLNGIASFALVYLLLRRVPLHRTTVARRPALTAALVATGWMLLPINLTSVLYIVQRMESLANLFVLLALILYVSWRARMQESTSGRYFVALVVSLTLLPALGLLAKETAILTPLYAFLIECFAFKGRSLSVHGEHPRDRRIAWLYVVLLAAPLAAGLAWLLPGLLTGNSWARRDFTLTTRLLSELRIVLDYIVWTITPSADALSFYHDDFVVSTGWLSPASTLLAAVVLLALALGAWVSRRRFPLASLGIALYFAGHALTATIIPLELVYEHRNYFPSLGLLLVVVPSLVPQGSAIDGSSSLPLARWALVTAFLAYWFTQTAMTAAAWGTPLSLSVELADRGPRSPRAQYELGRTYIILSKYDKNSPFADLVYAPLERAAALPQSSILPEQALIFFNARMHEPIKDAWWDSMDAKLRRRKPGVQDESALGALSSCQISGNCDLPKERMVDAFATALNYPRPSARLQAMYGDYAMGVLGDHALAIRMLQGACETYPEEPAYHVTLARFLIVDGDYAEAEKQIAQLNSLNVGGSLDGDIADLRKRLGAAKSS